METFLLSFLLRILMDLQVRIVDTHSYASRSQILKEDNHSFLFKIVAFVE